jgi:hypothetical protein
MNKSKNDFNPPNPTSLAKKPSIDVGIPTEPKASFALSVHDALDGGVPDSQ